MAADELAATVGREAGSELIDAEDDKRRQRGNARMIEVALEVMREYRDSANKPYLPASIG